MIGMNPIFAIDVNATDQVTPMLVDLQRSLTDRTELNGYIAGNCETLTKRHVKANKQEHATASRLGATPTYYFQKVSELIESRADKDAAVVMIPTGEAAISNLSKSAGGEAIGTRGPFAPVEGPVHIVAINAEYLTIPISKYSYGRRAREFSGTFVVTTKKGTKLIGQREGKETRWLYLLKEEVNLKEDRTLLPTDDQFLQAAELGAHDFIDHLPGGKAA
jgi:hypothetical protein